jgi:hypothetical protein
MGDDRLISLPEVSGELLDRFDEESLRLVSG